MRIKHLVVCILYSVLFVLALQAQELLNYPLDTINGEEVYKYEVEKSIGLYRIGVNFNIAQSEIIRLNPQLRERGLHYGETLLIPTGRPVVIESKPKVVETLVTNTRVPSESQPSAETVDIKEMPISPIAEEKETTPDTMAVENVVTDTMVSEPDNRHVIELALMLPFESQQTKRSGNAERMMEFYQGALLALHDLQNDSTLYRLRVYDTERSERRVNALCDSTELDSVKGVLGLIYPIQIERMAEWCEIHQVPLLVPFSDDIDLSTHSQVLQFNSTDAQEADSLCRWMMQQDSTAHFVAVEVREADLASSIRTLRKRMHANKIAYTGMALRDLLVDSCAYALDLEKENIVILHSDRYQQVRMVLPHLEKLQREGYRIRIVSQYSWQKEKIFLPQVYTSMFKTEGNRETYDALWAESFRGGHVSEAPRYDLLGYDLMQALVAWLNGEQAHKGLQSDILWTQFNKGGYQNAQVLIIKN